jgi:hypothetical protein
VRVRAVNVAAGLAVAVAACSGGSAGGTAAPVSSPPGRVVAGGSGATSPVGGVFRLPGSACDLADVVAVERLSDRSPVVGRSVASSAPKPGQRFLSCAFTAGFVPVGALTVGVRAADPGVSARQELQDSVTASAYGHGDARDVPGVGDAARYGTTPSLAGTTFATIWVVSVRGGQVLDLSVTSAAKNPAAARVPLVAMARSALAAL